MTRPITIVPAPAAKGLEFDAVVVVEPAVIAGDDPRGLRLLYVALTRPIQHLSIIHAAPLPTRWRTESPPLPYDPFHGHGPERQGGAHHGRQQRYRRGRRPSPGERGSPRGAGGHRQTRGKAVADEIGGRFVLTDVADPAASTAAVAFAVEAFGGLHFAHLNAGVTSWCSMGDDFDPEAYRRSMSINLDGVVYGIAATRHAIKASGGGTMWPRPPWRASWSRPRPHLCRQQAHGGRLGPLIG